MLRVVLLAVMALNTVWATTALANTRPERVMIVLVDGLNPNNFRYAMDTGHMPNFARVFGNGAFAEQAFAVFPTFTGPNHGSVITGAWPVRLGVVGNTVYSRESDAELRVWGQDNSAFHLYSDLMSPESITLFEVLEAVDPAWVTVAAGDFADRGADRSFWDTVQGLEPGIPLQIGQIGNPGVPMLPPNPSIPAIVEAQTDTNTTIAAMVQFDNQFTQHAVQSAADFKLMYFWQLASDGFGEVYGPHTRKTIEVGLAQIDANFGQVLTAMSAAGTLDQTLFVLTSDHGMRKLSESQSPPLSMAQAVRDAGEENYYFSGTGQGVWLTQPDRDEIAGLEQEALFAQRMERSFEALLEHPQVTIVARWQTPVQARAGVGTIVIAGDNGGRAELVVRERGQHVRDAVWDYRVIRGDDPLQASLCYPRLEPEVDPNEEPRGPLAEGHCVEQAYPDAQRRLLGLLQSPLAPDVVFTRSGAIDQGGGGTHGELDYEASRVPLVFAGKGAASGVVTTPMNNVDIAPTVLAALGLSVPEQMDGEVQCGLLAEGLCALPAAPARGTAADSSRAGALCGWLWALMLILSQRVRTMAASIRPAAVGNLRFFAP